MHIGAKRQVLPELMHMCGIETRYAVTRDLMSLRDPRSGLQLTVDTGCRPHKALSIL
jgi:hypothetical protein